ncbi:MAG: MotA/TolQ/ExbB proton channel family protein [Hyphomicrobiales bacterium]|nr:MotA/TolQ/ExbB proton channel family protein [Rickettsiales bacterium]MCP5361095.1 MotA/TolQ/ExbB proton channel family protein [Hyphomicrobiales bacterium]
MDAIFDLFAKGGIVMGIIFCLSIYVTAVIIYKFYQFYRMQTLNPLFIDQIDQTMERETMKQRLMNARLDTNPVARVMLSALQSIDRVTGTPGHVSLDLVKEEIARAGSTEVRYLESHMRGLELVATIAPLLGLLGTVIGMVSAFSAVEQSGSRVDPSLLAGGIWTALLTTVAGLAVAIPALAAHYLFDEQIEKMRVCMQDIATRLLFNTELQQTLEVTTQSATPRGPATPRLQAIRRNTPPTAAG